MERLGAGDLAGPAFPVQQYLQLRGQEIMGNPRGEKSYKEQRLEAVGLGSTPPDMLISFKATILGIAPTCSCYDG